MTDQPPLDLSLFGDEHVRQYEATGGEAGYLWNGAPCLVLTTTGARSGQQRKSALIFGADGDDCVLIASKGGAPAHPDWYRNLVAHPRVRVQVQGDVFDAEARTVEGPERERLWTLMTAIWPSYDEYQARTERRIPVVLLERVR
jgi:deazaflavin-dependent oxidoreductase (nitroreductase family)